MIRFRKRLRRSKPPSRNFASISLEATDPIHEKKRLPKQPLELVGRDGFEPSTNWLKANCSTD
jgi:hypothetical protein